MLFGKVSDPFLRMFRKIISYKSGLIANTWWARLPGPPAATAWGQGAGAGGVELTTGLARFQTPYRWLRPATHAARTAPPRRRPNSAAAAAHLAAAHLAAAHGRDGCAGWEPALPSLARLAAPRLLLWMISGFPF